MNTQTHPKHIISYSRPLLPAPNSLLLPDHLTVFIREARAQQLAWVFVGALFLLIPLGTLMLAKVSDTAGANLAQTRMISLFISSSNPRTDTIVKTLRRNQQVHRATVVSPQITPVIAGTQSVDMIEIVPDHRLNQQTLTEFIEQLQSLPDIEHIEFDGGLLARNERALAVARITSAVLYAMAMLLCVVVTGRLIRQDVRSGTQLIRIKLELGATSHQICAPYYYRAVLLGLMVSVVGLSLIWGMSQIARPLDDNSSYLALFTFDINQILTFTALVILTSIVMTKQTAKRIISIYTDG